MSIHDIRKAWISTILLAVVVIPCANALAWGGHEGHREVVVVGHERYHYHDGRFFRPGWFGLEVEIGIPPVGAVVTAIPFGYTTVIVGGEPYYSYNHVYYRRHMGGYIVVPEPIIVQQPVVVQQPAVYAQPLPVVPQTVTPATQDNGDVIVINIPNSNGGYTPVRLIRRYKGYEGPQGEYYPEHPTVDQLKVLYGK